DTMPDARSVEDLKEQIGRIGDLVEKVAQQLALSIGSEEGGKNMQATLKNLAEATEAINQTVRENREVIKDALQNVDHITQVSGPEIQRILVNVRVITDDVKQLLAAQGDKEGQQGELRTTIERVNRASKSLESALSHIDNIAGRIDRGEGTVGKLTKDETLIN